MDGAQNKREQVFHNGKSPMATNHSSPSTDNKFEELNDFEVTEDEPPVVQIERDLDELTYSGAAINDLEMQLIRSKHRYQRVLVDGKLHVEMLRRKLHSHIVKSEPFIEIWRKARWVQDMSNRAAAQYDKANSQHTASKEMIRVAESQLAACREEEEALEEPSSPSPLDLAWQEMLNHATAKVVVTERERRDGELEHRRVLEDCKKVMDEYRAIERKLRSHIVKSRPYFQERYRVNQHLAKLKDTMKDLEQKINESKQSYSASLKRLEVLNTEMHERRGTYSGSRHHLDPRQVCSTGTSPEMRRAPMMKEDDDDDDVASVDSLQLSRVAADYSGSTGSLPSIGVLSNSELSQTCESDTNFCKTPSQDMYGGSSSEYLNGVPWHQNQGTVPPSRDRSEILSERVPSVPPSQSHSGIVSSREQERVPSVPPSQSHSGILSSRRVPSIPPSQACGGILSSSEQERVPSIPPSQACGGILSSSEQERVPSVPSSQACGGILSSSEQERVPSIPPSHAHSSVNHGVQVSPYHYKAPSYRHKDPSDQDLHDVVAPNHSLEQEECSHVAGELVEHCLTTALSRLNQEDSSSAT